MGELLALASAVSFGLTHFAAGLAARRTAGVTVALYAQLCGTVVSATAALAAPGAGSLNAAGLGWGALSGVGTGVGVAFLYRAMAKGAMSVVVPVSDVTAVALPVVVGIALLGERPAAAALAGIAAAFPALWLVSRGGSGGVGAPDGSQRGDSSYAEHARTGRHQVAAQDARAAQRTPSADAPTGTARDPVARCARPAQRAAGLGGRSRFGGGTWDALLAGVGFAVHFLAVARMPADGELWAVTVSRVVSVAAVAAAVLGDRAPWRLPARCAPHVVAAGVLGTLATLLYLYAARQQLMAVATVLAALYPAIPVLLALVVLRERLSPWQSAGLLCAGAAIGLIAVA